ncbi:MAG: hypothetical protein ABI401_09245 [Candidatus Dormibacter sp.]
MALLAAMLAAMLAACTTAQPAQSGVTYQTYTYRCCENGETMQVWHPGERRTIKWTVVPAARSGSASGTPVVITTRMTGPFTTVAALKDATANSKPDPSTRKIDGTPLHIDNHTTDGVVSLIQLPADLPTGLYNLDLITDYGEGNRATSGTIIVVN